MAMVLRVAVAFILTADVIAIAAAILESGSITSAPLILLVTGAITLVLAMPAYFVLRLRRRETWLRCILAGFIVGAAVAALVQLPVSWSEQIGRDVTVVAGVRTAAGWRLFAQAAGIAGCIGAVGGAVFWATLRLVETGANWSRLRHGPLTAGIGLAIAASWTIFAIPGLTMDRSCHNMLRDGRPSIGPALFFTVELAAGEWPRLQDTIERFAAEEKWSLDESDDKDRAFSQSRFVSACVEPGTDIMVEGADAAGPTRAMVFVYQPQGGASWEQPAGRLLASIDEGFPGRLRHAMGDTGVQTPSTLLLRH